MKTSRLSPERKKTVKLIGICFGLTILAFSAFNTVLENDFIDYDDPGYVTENPYVRQGFTSETVFWSLKSGIWGW